MDLRRMKEASSSKNLFCKKARGRSNPVHLPENWMCHSCSHYRRKTSTPFFNRLLTRSTRTSTFYLYVITSHSLYTTIQGVAHLDRRFYTFPPNQRPFIQEGITLANPLNKR